MNNMVLQANQLSKSFHDAGQIVNVLKEINLSIPSGKKIAIMGASGSGKSTLLHLLGGLDKASSGEVSIAGKTIRHLSQASLSHLRGKYLGFIYQFHHLLPELTAIENVALPAVINEASVNHAKQKARQLLMQVGLRHRIAHRPAQLSGGERQRVAIARALVNNPVCVLADEPTGNLDRKTAEQIHDLINQLNQEFNTSFLIATHDPHLAEQMDQILYLRDGVLSSV